MDAEKLLDELTIYDELPRAAIGWATEHRAEALPIFLDAIEEFLAEKDPEPEVPNPIFMIFHILGSWQEKSAYRPIARVLMSDPERLDWTLGDALTQTMNRVMVNLYDGDPQPLYEIARSETANMWARSGIFELIADLGARGAMPKDEAVRFLRDSYDVLPQREDPAWIGWHFAVAWLGLGELSSLVERAIDRRFIDRRMTTKRGFREELRRAMTNPDDPEIRRWREIEPFGDTIEELSQWHSSSEEYLDALTEDDDDGIPFEDDPYDTSPGEPVTNPYRHVGRNDPCPCGSCKKFKRCCLNKAA
jgi:hypothetical protein